MAYTLSTRSLTSREQEQLRTSSRLSLDDWTWVLVSGPSFGFAGYMFGLAVEWFSSLLTLDAAPYAHIGFAILGVCLGLFNSVYIYGAFKGSANAAKSDLMNECVQVIHVSDASVIQQQEYNSEGPILYFKLDSETILFLWGQWLFNPYVYGAENHAVDDDAETFLNAQDCEYAFPCTEFTVHRSPTLGRVLKIETNGKPLLPIKSLAWRDIPLQNFADSEILQGSFDDLSGTMLRCKRIHQSNNVT